MIGTFPLASCILVRLHTTTAVEVKGLKNCAIEPLSREWLVNLSGDHISEPLRLRNGIAQWLERLTRDRKVACSSTGRGRGRTFFCRVSFLSLTLFRYSFRPRFTAVARTKSRPFCQKCRWQVYIVKHIYTLRMWFFMK